MNETARKIYALLEVIFAGPTRQWDHEMRQLAIELAALKSTPEEKQEKK